MEKVLDKAIKFAVDAHTNDKRKKTDIPYIVHPLEVVTIVATMTTDKNVLAASVLHDVVEDTKFTLEDIRHEFGDLVAEYVVSQSENKRENLPAEDTWKIRKQESLEHFKSANKKMKMITLGDKLSNLRSIKRDYQQLGEELWQRFNQKDKKQHAWYYGSIADILAVDLADYDAFQEYRNLVDEVFA